MELAFCLAGKALAGVVALPIPGVASAGALGSGLPMAGVAAAGVSLSVDEDEDDEVVSSSDPASL